MYAIVKDDKIVSLTTFKSDVVVDITELGAFAKVGLIIWDCYKEMYKKQLWSLMPTKVANAKKTIIGKPEMADDELEVQLELYKKKYQDALDGLDVFEGQALALGMNQEDYRNNVVIPKGNAFVLYEKKINDVIEMTRGLMEDRINEISSVEDVERVRGLFLEVDGFTIMTPINDIVEKLS